MKRFFQDCFAVFDGGILELGNSRIRRRFDLSQGQLRTLELSDGDGTPLAGENPESSDFHFYGDRCPAEEMKYKVLSVGAVAVTALRDEAPHLHVTVSIYEGRQRRTLRRDFYLYPELAAIAMRCRICSPVLPNTLWSFRSRIRENFQKNARRGLTYEGCVDMLRTVSAFRPARSVEFRGQTDFNDDQVIGHPLENAKRAVGNLLYLDDVRGAGSGGLFYLQEAPPSEERRDLEEYDFRFDGELCYSCSWNLSPGELGSDREFRSPRHVLFRYRDGEDPELLLKEYLKRRYQGDKFCRAITANPWGESNFYQLLSPEFLMAELPAARECGAEIYQIDDSWQHGGVLGDLTGRNTRIDPAEFWKVAPRFWNGDLSVPAERARECGVALSLWFAPSGNVAYRDWRETAEIMIDYHRRFHIRVFKLDAINLPNAEAERNLELLLRTVRRKTGGDVSFQIDLTGWGQRMGYFRYFEFGAIFLENRYTREMSGIGYHPERTWRNIWRLAPYVRLQFFQFEVPAPGGINYEFYRKKGECAPDCYPWSCWIAPTLFSNPLLWFAPSLLPSEARGEVARMLNWRKKNAARLNASEIRRFGDEPSGESLSGLIAVSDAPLVMAWRGRNCAADRCRAPLPAGRKWRAVLGAGEIIEERNAVSVRVADQPGFAIFETVE